MQRRQVTKADKLIAYAFSQVEKYPDINQFFRIEKNEKGFAFHFDGLNDLCEPEQSILQLDYKYAPDSSMYYHKHCYKNIHSELKTYNRNQKLRKEKLAKGHYTLDVVLDKILAIKGVLPADIIKGFRKNPIISCNEFRRESQSVKLEQLIGGSSSLDSQLWMDNGHITATIEIAPNVNWAEACLSLDCIQVPQIVMDSWEEGETLVTQIVDHPAFEGLIMESFFKFDDLNIETIFINITPNKVSIPMAI